MGKASLVELEAVVAVATRKSFRGAARVLGMSPSALSHAVSALEERVGARLFHRTTRSVSLTAAGAELVARVDPAVREIAAAVDAVKEHRDVPSGTLRITTSATGARVYLLPVIVEMRRRHPEVRLEVVTEDRLVDIVAEGFDAGLRLAEAVPRDMIAVPCGPDPSMAVVGAPSYFELHAPPRTPADLAGHELIGRRMANGAVYRWELERRGRTILVEPSGGLVTDDDPLAVEAATAGLGLAFVSDVSVADRLADGRLVRVLEEYTPPFAGVRLFHPSRKLVPAALRALVAVVRDLGREGRGRRLR